MEMTDSSSPHERNRIGNILMCFSIYTNTKTIFSTELNTEAIPVIHGLKFLSMTWIIIVHTVFYTYDYFGKCLVTQTYVELIVYIILTQLICMHIISFYIDNKMWLLRFSEGIPVQVLSNASVSVDTYFILSGLLLTYMYLKDKTDKERNKPINYGEKLNEFFVAVIRRFIRYVSPLSCVIPRTINKDDAVGATASMVQ